MSSALRELVANLECRGRLGFGTVNGGKGDLEALVARLVPTAPQVNQTTTRPAAQTPAPELGGLEDIVAYMGQCKRCSLHRGRANIVFGQGPQGARVLFIGEAPGAQEDKRGLPFVGPAGHLLDRMLQAVGLRREDVYITNIVKCRPPNNRDPEPAEAAACRGFLDAQVKAVSPKVICTLGRPAAQAVLASDAPISAMRGNWHSAWGLPVLPTFHPAYLLRSPRQKAQAYQDLKELVRKIKN